MSGRCTGKMRTAEEAVGGIASGSTVAVGGAGGVQEVDLLLSTLIERFRTTGSPRDLTEIHPFRSGEREGTGTSLLGEPGLVASMIGGSFWPIGTPPLIERILDGSIAAYNIPSGVIYAMLEAAAANRPGILSRVGLETFADPRQGGGALNESSKERFSEIVTIGGEECIFYRALRPDVALIRATAADPAGNLVMTEEPALVGGLVLAQATRANGGFVVAQVKEIRPAGSLDPHQVRVPGMLVDAVVEHPGQLQIPASVFDPSLVTAGPTTTDLFDAQPLDAAKVVQRRALMECHPGDRLVIGFGLAARLPGVAHEEGVLDQLTFTIEHGVIGGVNPCARGGKTFPAAHRPTAIIDAADQLRFYAGGGMDMAFLGVGQVDSAGNVNVSRFGNRLSGAGGFIDITQGIGKLVFCCVLGENARRKFVPAVEHVTFNGEYAARSGADVTYVTEFAVFRLTGAGLTLVEVAPGWTPQRVADVVGCEFAFADDVAPMPEECWAPGGMGLAEVWQRSGTRQEAP